MLGGILFTHFLYKVYIKKVSEQLDLFFVCKIPFKSIAAMKNSFLCPCAVHAFYKIKRVHILKQFSLQCPCIEDRR